MATVLVVLTAACCSRCVVREGPLYSWNLITLLNDVIEPCTPVVMVTRGVVVVVVVSWQLRLLATQFDAVLVFTSTTVERQQHALIIRQTPARRHHRIITAHSLDFHSSSLPSPPPFFASPPSPVPFPPPSLPSPPLPSISRFSSLPP